MFVAFDELKPESRVWIYQAQREFSPKEIDVINARLLQFVSQWKRHGEDLKASFIVKYNQFIILAVDESFNNVSGCSIDASMHEIMQLEKDLNMDLTDKLKVAFKSGDIVNTTSINDFQHYIKEGKVNSNTLVFNNMVSDKKSLETSWEIPANQSWHQRYFK